MRVVPRRSKGRRQDGDPARTAPSQAPPGASGTPETPPAAPDPGLKWPPSPASRAPSAGPADSGRPEGGEAGTTRPLPAAGAPGAADPAEAPGQEDSRDGTLPTRELPAPPSPGAAAQTPGQGADATTAVLPPMTGSVAGAEAARRRARAAERQRMAAEVKRSRAARRQGLPYREVPPVARAADQHRSAMLIMVLTLGLLIAAVVVTGALIASSMRTQPVTLASPLHIYPVTQATAGPCPAGTQGITGQSGTGPTCYRLSQGIAIRRVADLRVQESRVRPGGYDVAVTLRPSDRAAFADLTRATVGRDLAFVVENRIVTLPRVDMAIADGKVVVTGPPDRASANRLVRELKGR
ncbi:SecDF P1 head subdomain-containing protein [Actinomadura welshii]